MRHIVGSEYDCYLITLSLVVILRNRQAPLALEVWSTKLFDTFYATLIWNKQTTVTQSTQMQHSSQGISLVSRTLERFPLFPSAYPLNLAYTSQSQLASPSKLFVDVYQETQEVCKTNCTSFVIDWTHWIQRPDNVYLISFPTERLWQHWDLNPQPIYDALSVKKQTQIWTQAVCSVLCCQPFRA